METDDSVIKKYDQSHEQRLQRHINVEALQLLNNGGLVRRLKRTKQFELVHYFIFVRASDLYLCLYNQLFALYHYVFKFLTP